MRPPVTDRLPISVRAYAAAPFRPDSRVLSSNEPRAQEPSEWTVVFDTETTTDAAQRLRIGSYQVRKGVELEDAGLFFDPGALSNDELATPKLYASDRGLEVRTVAEFVTDIFSASVTNCAPPSSASTSPSISHVWP